jgi:hypothetical protein
MENSPPGIHTIPSGAGPGGVPVFELVCTNVDAGIGMSAAGVDICLDRVVVQANAAAPAKAKSAAQCQIGRPGRGCDVDLGCFRRDLLMSPRLSNAATSSTYYREGVKPSIDCRRLGVSCNRSEV